MEVESGDPGTAAAVPPQVRPSKIHDFRFKAWGPRGYKMNNKRKIDQLQEQVPVF
jgi:hypothetical protein